MRGKLKFRKAFEICLMAGLVGASLPLYAATQTFTSDPTVTTVGATATFTTSLNQVDITLTATNSDPLSTAQLLSDLSFDVSGGGAVQSSSGPAGSLIHCADGGCTAVAGTAFPWTLSGGSGSYLLTALVGNDKTLIIGPLSAGYCSPGCPDGIGSNNFNTFINQTGTFTLGISGVTSDSVISNVAFSFGTGPETVVGVPIPAAVWLFGSGLIGLIGIARRKSTVVPTATPALA